MLKPKFERGQDLIWKRNASGELETNVERVVVHHSPDGFELGYSGSGPADLALNVMSSLFPLENLKLDEETEDIFSVKCYDGNRVSLMAWNLYQEFKEKFLSTADKDSGTIYWNNIENWLTVRLLKGIYK